jgi:3-oxoacyl-[acyl-carrier protein] reductase
MIRDRSASQMSGLLAGKVAIITGGGRGVGAETARHFASAGCKVAVNYLQNADAADGVVSEINASGGAALAVQADVRHEGQVARMVVTVRKRWGIPDILVLNADVGGFCPTPFLEIGVADYIARAENELAAALMPVKALVPEMTERRAGCILAMSSALCRAPVSGFSLLSVSKAALEGLVRALAVELGPLGIRINIIEASMIDGENSGVVADAQRAWVRRAIPLGRVAHPADIAQVMTLIASDAAGFVNGATIPVNGGQVLF